MPMPLLRRRTLALTLAAATLAACSTTAPPAAAPAAPATPARAADSALRERTQAEVPAYLKTLESLVAIESGSRDLEGLKRMAGVVADRLRAAGMQVELKPSRAPDFHPQLKGAELGSSVYATRTGTGTKKVLLIAHMDTVYPRGMAAKQPFRIDGDRAYGLGIADDKQGVALILHVVDLLARQGFADYAQLGVLINGDEEIGSPGSGPLITQLGSEYDAVFSFEGGGNAAAGGGDMVRLATSSIAIVEMKVTGKASHAGAAPHLGRNALYELSHQMLKSRGFGDPAKGLQINWTVASAGGSRNVIPAERHRGGRRALADQRRPGPDGSRAQEVHPGQADPRYNDRPQLLPQPPRLRGQRRRACAGAACGGRVWRTGPAHRHPRPCHRRRHRCRLRRPAPPRRRAGKLRPARLRLAFQQRRVRAGVERSGRGCTWPRAW
jgi:hypothetical protein